MKKKLVSNPVKEHAHKCLDLSIDIEEMLKGVDLHKDGGLTSSFIEGIGKHSAEEAIYNTLQAGEFLIGRYRNDKDFRESLEAYLIKEQFCGNNFTGADALLLIQIVFKDAFNLYTPAYFEMFKLRTNHELFTDDELTYIREKFVNGLYN